MVRKTQQRSLDTRTRILSVTRQLFEELGEKNVTTDMIARRAQVAKGTIFAHFEDRPNLVAAIGAQELEAIIGKISASVRVQTDANLTDRLMLVYQPLLRFFAGKPEFARLYVNSAAHAASEWSAGFIEACLGSERILGDILLQAKNDGTFDAELQTEFLVDGMQAFFMQIVIYRMAGWIGDDDAQAEQRLRRYLNRWLDRKD